MYNEVRTSLNKMWYVDFFWMRLLLVCGLGLSCYYTSALVIGLAHSSLDFVFWTIVLYVFWVVWVGLCGICESSLIGYFWLCTWGSFYSCEVW